MNTPTLPHVTLPSVSLPHIGVPDVTHRVADRAGDVGELVTDVWATGRGKVQDLAATAVDVIEDIPEKAIALAGAVIPALRPTPKRSKRPFVLIAAVVTALVLVAWFVKKRNGGSAEPYAVPSSPSSETKMSAVS